MLDRNDAWEKYVDLIEKFGAHIDREFYFYTTEPHVKGLPQRPGQWPASDIKGTVFRRYYTGGTFCFIQDRTGHTFIGIAICSEKETSFRKKTGRNVAKMRALAAMCLAYKICEERESIAVAKLTGNGLKHITVVVGEDKEVTGFILDGVLDCMALYTR